MSETAVREHQAPPASRPTTLGGTNLLALLSLIFAFVFSPVGIVLGHMAKRQIRQSGEQGNGLATVGLVLGYVFTVLGILYFVGVALLMASGGSGA
ncbi:DUF4190 domain-containing protein [Micromonospora sp. SH-82]|uniref:DUF4190 domain-containing protein n=1 Tax=Micromonospora sp. SH-82 TaxID=3132938 RepID=UPI003EB94CE0